jgi:hypothetical protein
MFFPTWKKNSKNLGEEKKIVVLIWNDERCGGKQ